MKYLLIAMLFESNGHSTTSIVAEFNTLSACRAAATEVQKQAAVKYVAREEKIILCAAKG